MMTNRKKPKRYVRRSERVGDQVHTHYIGTLNDPITRILVQSDELSQAIKRSASDFNESALVRQHELEPCQQYLATRVTRFLAGEQQRQGREQEKQGSHRRISSMETILEMGLGHVSLSRDEGDEIVEDAAQGDETALAELKEILYANPAVRELLGDLSRHVQTTLIDIVGAESIATREALKIQIEALRNKLHHRDANPLERLVIEQVITTKLDLAIQQIGCAGPHIKETHRRRWEGRMARAQKRHLAALSALAEIIKCSNGESRKF